VKGIRRYFQRQRVEQELDKELRFHLENLVEENLQRGMSVEEARRQAVLQFGGPAHIRERCREVRPLGSLETMCSDIRYGVRGLHASKAFAAAAVLSLALGIGANTAIFTIINAIMLRMLPVENPEQLVRVTRMIPHGNERIVGSNFSYPNYLQFRDNNQVFAGLAAVPRGTLAAAFGADAEPVRAQLVSGNFFSVLGVDPILGSGFSADDERNPRFAVVLSYLFWQRQFAGDPSVIGKQITLNRALFTIVGVAPRHFQGAEPGLDCDLWTPITSQAQLMPNSSLNLRTQGWLWLGMIGRLKPGVDIAEARANLRVIFQQLLSADKTNGWLDQERRERQTQQLDVVPAATGLDTLRQQFARPLFVLMGIVGLLLLITCANVSNLLLARAAARQKEMAIRLALGASRRRLIRQLLTEALLLSLVGGGFGILFAYWGSDLLVHLFSSGNKVAIVLNLTPDVKILSFTLLLSLLTAIIFGVAPAFIASRANPNSALKNDIGGPLTRRLTLGRILVISEVALSLMLLIGAGLFVHTFANLINMNAGFQQGHVLLFSLDPPRKVYQGQRRGQLYEQLLERIRTTPRVLSASFSTVTPITGGGRDGIISVEGYTPQPSENMHTELNEVENDYFTTMGTPLLSGRDFRAQDNQVSPGSAIINEAMARAYFPNANPIGHRFVVGADGDKLQIVGVVKNSRYTSLREELRPQAYIYAPYLFRNDPPNFSFEVREAGNPLDLVPSLAEELRAIDPELKLLNVRSLKQQVENSLHQERLIAILSTFFGILALVLACLGVYGVITYNMARRTSEIGIRIAVGARPWDIKQLVFAESLRLIVAGVVLGIAPGLAATGLLRGLLYGISWMDPWVVGVACLTLAAVASFAAWLPAARAARIDPNMALRHG
jgi:predicted permease